MSFSIIRDKTDTGLTKINQYIVLKTLGKGHFGKVKLCSIEQTKEYRAMKVVSKKRMKGMQISKDKTAYITLANEIAILKKINHHNIVKLYEIIDDEKSDKLYMIMEYINGGTLMSKIKTTQLTPRNIWTYFRGLVLGIEYCHEKAGVVHRDIKPENIMLDTQGNVKIADFGVSYMMDSSMNDELETVVGSQYFMAPEICNSKKFKGKPNDIWALGVTLYFMIANKLPFTGNNVGELFHCITHDQVVYPECVSELQRDLLQMLFEKDPDKRIKITDIKKHAWVTCNGQLKLQELNDDRIVADADDVKQAFSLVKIFTKIKCVMHNKLQNLRKRKAKQNIN